MFPWHDVTAAVWVGLVNEATFTFFSPLKCALYVCMENISKNAFEQNLSPVRNLLMIQFPPVS